MGSDFMINRMTESLRVKEVVSKRREHHRGDQGESFEDELEGQENGKKPKPPENAAKPTTLKPASSDTSDGDKHLLDVEL